MAWTPTINTIKTRKVADNVLTYITDATRQGQAYTWAGSSGLKLIKKFSASVANRTVPVYPSIAFSDDNDAQNLENDIIVAAYSVTFEVSIQSASPDTATTNAKAYRDALVSMIANCPTATVVSGTNATDAHIATLETGFEPIKAHTKRQNDFLQVFQIRAAFVLTAGKYT